MKKIATYFSLAIITMACATLVSCNSNNSDPDPEPPVPTVKKADVQYSIPNLYDLHLLADVSITYIDATGKSITENIATTPWQKEVKGITPPFTAKMTLTVKRKAGVTYDRTYKIGSGYSLLYKINSDTMYSAGSGSSVSGSTSFPSSTIEAKLIKLEETPSTHTLEIPALK